MAAFPIPPEQRAIRRVTGLYDLPIRSIFINATDLARASIDIQTLSALVRDGSTLPGQLRILTGVETLIGRLQVDLGPLFEEMLTRGAIVGEEVFAEFLGVPPVDISTFRRMAQSVAREQVGTLIQGIETGWTDPITGAHIPGEIDTIRSLIETGYAEGRSPGQTAQLIREVIGLDDRRAQALINYRAELEAEGYSGDRLERMVAREMRRKLKSRALTISETETIRAASEAQDLVWKEAVKQRQIDDIYEQVWIATPNACPRCKALHLSRALIGKEFPPPGDLGPPLHPRCLPGGVEVLPIGAARAATERPYDGVIIVFRTAAGYELACTPNHPILTPGGWITAHLLGVGNEVISRRGGKVGWERGMENEQRPASIHDVAEALRRSRHVATVEVEVSAEDFHGDVTAKGQIATVCANRFLLNDLLAARAKICRQALLQLAYLAADRLPSRRPFLTQRGPALQELRLVLHAANGGMGRLRVPLPDLWRCPRHPDQGLLVGGSQGDLRVSQSPADDGAGDPEAISELQDRLAGYVQQDQIVNRQIKYHGAHVFNLQTSSGAYFAGGIVTHNCRCHRRLERRKATASDDRAA